MKDTLIALGMGALVAVGAASRGQSPITEGLFAFGVTWLLLVFWRGYRERNLPDDGKDPRHRDWMDRR